MLYYTGFAAELAKRGISTLVMDTPGSGEALRMRGLKARYDTEVWASACVDYLENDPEVDQTRIGLVGWSLGGYYAPRAAAFEKRLKLVVAWGALHDWGGDSALPTKTRSREPCSTLLGPRLLGMGVKDVNEFFADRR
ncbi:alpha/beta hydrolase family protein [Arthrobacter sp. SD76]|uniref:alpha/beta hydrolase family protein n=1 Tax=Arthrobacter sp. SD76 TaxID=3415007 RepID=UPI003C768032